MTDTKDQNPGYALQVRNNRWRLVVDLASMTEAAAVVARIARGPGAIKVAVDVYDPVKDRYDRKDHLTFAGLRPSPGGATPASLFREFGRLSGGARTVFAALILSTLGLAGLGAYGLAAGAFGGGSAPTVREAPSAPTPSRVLPRAWTSAPELRDIPAEFRGEWSANCAAARLNGTGMLAVTARSLFGQPVAWVRVDGRRVLVNSGPDGASVSTQIRSDSLALYLEDRFTEVIERDGGRNAFSPERPLALSKCL